MNAQFLTAINQIADEKGLPRETILDTVEAALAAAYKKDYGDKDQDVRVKLNEDTGDMKVFVSKEVVNEVENENTQILLADARKLDKDAKVIEVDPESEDEPYKVEMEVDPGEGFGRVAAQPRNR